MGDPHALHDIHVDVRLDSLTQSANGAITGEVSVSADGVRFPDADWNDFVVVVLGWWAEKCASMLSGSRREELWFMDGPYILDVEAISEDVWSVRYKRWRSSASTSTIESESVAELPNGLEVEASVFARNVKSTAGAVLNECHQRGWTTPDLETLRRRYDTLRSQLNA
jgi:hypothetical protein